MEGRLARLGEGHAPQLLTVVGIGPDTAVILLITMGDPEPGLRLPDLTLTAGWWLHAALHLRPGAPLTLEDDRGLALRLICWRTEYERSSYHLAWPRMTGCAVVIRPDLLEVLAERAPATVVIRDFVMLLRHGEEGK
ncbi:hypothetical protein [Streptomyces sp. JNUCC 63]